MRATVHILKIVLFTLFLCALTFTSNADILEKEQSNYNSPYYALSYDEEFLENSYGREELEDIRRDAAIDYTTKFIGNKFKKTPIGQYTLRKFDVLTSYGRIEYSKKRNSENANLYLPGDINRKIDEYEYDYRLSFGFSLYIKDSKPCPTTKVIWIYKNIDYTIGYDIRFYETFLIIKKKVNKLIDVGIAYEMERIEEGKEEKLYLFLLKVF